MCATRLMPVAKKLGSSSAPGVEAGKSGEERPPPDETLTPLLAFRRLTKHFPVRGGFFGRQTATVHAIHDLAFELRDPLRDRRLGRVELLGGAAEAAERDHPHEGFHCLEIGHAPSACSLIS